MFKEGPIRSILKGQGWRPPGPSSTWRDFERMSMEALPGEREAYELYVKLAWMARELGEEDLATKYDEIARDEMDHYRIINDEILSAIRARRYIETLVPPSWRR